jgi:hypothetical protein
MFSIIVIVLIGWLIYEFNNPLHIDDDDYF